MQQRSLSLNYLQGLQSRFMTHSKSWKSEPEPKSPQEKISSLPFALHLSAATLRQGGRMVKKGIQRFQRLSLRNQVVAAALMGSILSFQVHLFPSFEQSSPIQSSAYPPLRMTGGDPYVRALMRTISVSESNDPNPYGLLYGGEHFADWGQHPDRCIAIAAGPNVGDCSTAAGRYQFITTTWEQKAHLYHPKPEGWLFWQRYAFDPDSQDRVIYRWLTDTQAWDMDILAQLKSGQLLPVLRTLSGTWTSLGYGIETNEMTPHLSEMYQKFLKEEKAKAGSAVSISPQPPQTAAQ
jgi:muramidase (phage lysozyme)